MDSEQSYKLHTYQQRVNEQLDHCLPKTSQSPTGLHKAMRYAVLGGGKRLRALLLYTTGKALQVKIEWLDQLACAIECMHAYSLVHDDLPSMDNDAIRRNKPACHIAFNETTALLAGNALQTLAYELIATSPCLPQNRIQMIQCLAKATGSQGMMGGQFLDLNIPPKSTTHHRFIEQYALKTGALFNASIQIAALSSEDYSENKTIKQSLEQYAHTLGLLFQIQDDLFDLNPHEQQQKTLTSLIGTDESKTMINALYEKAQTTLAHLPFDTHLLEQMTDYIKQRPC